MARKRILRRRERRQVRQQARYYWSLATTQLKDEGKLDDLSTHTEIITAVQPRAIKLAEDDGVERPVLEAVKKAIVELMPFLVELAKTLLLGLITGLGEPGGEDDDDELDDDVVETI